MNQLIMNIAQDLVHAGIRVEMIPNGVSILDGFYKSDGMAYLVSDDNSGAVLKTRYDQQDSIESVRDVVKISLEWFAHSKDRYIGWNIAPGHWQKLYDEYNGVDVTPENNEVELLLAKVVHIINKHQQTFVYHQDIACVLYECKRALSSIIAKSSQ